MKQAIHRSKGTTIRASIVSYFILNQIHLSSFIPPRNHGLTSIAIVNMCPSEDVGSSLGRNKPLLLCSLNEVLKLLLASNSILVDF